MPPTTPKKSNGGKGAEDRRISRMHQMEMMEAAARGTAPTMQLDTSHVVNPPTQGLRSRNTSSSGEARRFLAEEEEDYHGPGGAANIQIGPAGSRTSTGAASLFNQRELYSVDQSVNLMDPATETYSSGASGKGKNSFVDIFLGGTGKTSGTGSTSSRGNTHTTWEQSVGGRLCILIFFVGFGVVLAMSVSFLFQDSGDGANGSGGFVKTGNRYDDIKSFLLLNSASHVEYLTDKSTSAYHALRWLTEVDPAKLAADDSEILARFALASFYYATHPDAAEDHSSGKVKTIDSGWNKDTNWMSEKSVCEWYGVDCETVGDGVKDVVHFNLTSNQVQGPLPLELKSLSNMVLLDLSSNQLTGTIPAPLCRMFQITYFMLQDNQLTGTIPNQIGLMEGASEIYLTKNSLQGSIPVSISKLSNLRALFLAQNQLGGKIPDLTGLAGLNHLDLEDNNLSGPIPFSVAKMPNLHDLRLNKNKLTGVVMSEFQNNKKLKLLYLGHNLLTGKLPNIFDDLSAMTDLELHNNRFTGQLPTSFRFMTNLRRLTIDSNKFSGTLPREWSEMTALEALTMHHNEVRGGIPSEFGALTKLMHIFLNQNFLQYNLPTELGLLTNLRDLFLERNAVRGEIPSELGKLTNLAKFRIFDAPQIEGTMPVEVCDLTKDKLKDLEADCKSKMTCECCSLCH